MMGCVSSAEKAAEVDLQELKNVLPLPLSLQAPQGSTSFPDICRVRTMKNELVLSLVAPHMPLEDLRRLRESCNAWNAACVPQMIDKHAPLVLATTDKKFDLVAGLYILAPGKLLKMSDYIEYLESRKPLPLPFGNYKIPAPAPVNYDRMKEFFSACGSSIRKLTMDDERYIWGDCSSEDRPGKMDMSIIRQIVFEWTPSLRELEILLHEKLEEAESGQKEEPAATASTKEIPNLRRLDVYVEVSPPPPGLINLLLEILTQASGLKHFSLSGPVEGEFLQILPAIRDSNPQLLGKLTGLKLLEVRDEDMRLLIDLATPTRGKTSQGLRLQEMEIQIDTDAYGDIFEADTLLGEFLKTQATSLQKLEIQIVGVCATMQQFILKTPFLLHIPALPKLRYFRRDRLTMAPVLIGFGRVMEAAASMNTALPALQRYEYNHIDSAARIAELAPHANDACFDDLARMFHPGVTELKLNVPLDEAEFSAFSSRLPAVTHLELRSTAASMSQLSVIWSMWPGLKSLTVWYRGGAQNLELDELLTGIPKSKHQLLGAELGAGMITLERLRQLQAEHKTSPALCDLAHLKKLHLVGEMGTPNTFTDIGGNFGLALANAGIQDLAIVNVAMGEGGAIGRNRNSISENCRRLIKSVFSPQALIYI